MKKDTSKRAKKYSHLNRKDREEIAIALEKGMKQYEIASFLQCHPSTISREIRRNNLSTKIVRYRAYLAQYLYNERKRESHKRHRTKVREYQIKS